MSEGLSLKKEKPGEKDDRGVLSLNSAREQHAIEASVERIADSLEKNPETLNDVELITTLTSLLNNPMGFGDEARKVLYRAAKKFLEINKGVDLMSVRVIQDLMNRAWPEEKARSARANPENK